MIVDLKGAERKVYSQNGEDGLTLKIFDAIGTTNRYYVEFGVETGQECNTRVLREQGWQGLLMDYGYKDPKINLRRHQVTAENVNDLFRKYGVPESFDLLAIDIDYNDLWVWKAVYPFCPRVVIIEWNCRLDPQQSLTVPYDPNGMWDMLTAFHGASLAALQKLGREKGYHLVGIEQVCANLFFVHDTALNGHVFVGMDALEHPRPDWIFPPTYRDPKGRTMVAY